MNLTVVSFSSVRAWDGTVPDSRHAQTPGDEPPGMVTVELVGEGTRDVEAGEGDTYADLLAPFDVSRHEVSILVEGRPVPEDAPVEASVERVRVVRLVKGGSGRETGRDPGRPSVK